MDDSASMKVTRSGTVCQQKSGVVGEDILFWNKLADVVELICSRS